jgi:hypothetical protein
MPESTVWNIMKHAGEIKEKRYSCISFWWFANIYKE